MNRREIFDVTMNRRSEDLRKGARVLVDQGKQVGSIHKYAYNDIRKAMGLPPVENPPILDRMSQCVVSGEDLLEAWGIDFRWLEPKWTQIEEVDKDHYRNLFGALFKDMGDCFSLFESPLKGKGIEALEDYPWPETNDPGMFEGLREQAEEWHENTDYVIGADGIKGGVFQSALEVRGYDQLYIDFALEPDYAHALLRKVTDLYKEMYTHYLTEVGEYIQIIYITDDFGAQNSLLLSPEMWAEFLKPYEGELIAHIKKQAPQVKVMFHTDGSVFPIIDGMIEMGVDILNPVQTSVDELSDTRALKENYGDRINFHGAVDVQKVLNNSTPEDIREEVKRRICDLGRGGGYILATCHNIGYDIPPENVKTLYEAAREFGTYPLPCG